MNKPKDKLKYEFNMITGQLDLVLEFNPNKIVTHELTPFGNSRMSFDPITNSYYEAGPDMVCDSNGSVVVI